MRRVHQAPEEPEVGQESDVVMNFNIPEADLVKALKELRLAKKAGFKASEACFELDSFQAHWGIANYTDVWLKAKPGDPNTNWGRTPIWKHGYTYDQKKGLLDSAGRTDADRMAEAKRGEELRKKYDVE